MSEFTNTMFESIKSALTQTPEAKTSYKDIIKYETGKTYVVRLLPNIKNPAKTFYHYYTQGFQSFSTGKYISAVSPATFNERDPISETKYKLLKTGSEEEKKKAETLVRREQWLVNCYVISDPTNPDNNNKVKALRFGRQLHKVITRAMDGEDADDLGARVFDLSSKGVNLKVVVENQGGFPTFVSSKFTSPKAIDGMDDKTAKETYNSTIDLENMFPARSYEQLKELLDEHFFCNTETNDTDTVAEVAVPRKSDPRVEPSRETAKATSVDDDEVKKLLSGLDND
jgi:hypothetical protein